MTLPIVLRAYEPDDEDLIVHSWLSSYRNARTWKRWFGRSPTTKEPVVRELPYFLNRPLWWDRYKPTIEHIISQAPITICCVKDTPEIVCGWRVGDEKVLHYVLVKRSYAKFRADILHKLMAGFIDQPVVYTHELLEIPEWPTVPAAWTFDPLLAFATEPSNPKSFPSRTSRSETSPSTDEPMGFSSSSTSDVTSTRRS